MEQRESVSLRWGRLIGSSVLITAVMSGAHWMFNSDATWTGHLTLGVIAGVAWFNVAVSGFRRRRKVSGLSAGPRYVSRQAGGPCGLPPEPGRPVDSVRATGTAVVAGDRGCDLGVDK